MTPEFSPTERADLDAMLNARDPESNKRSIFKKFIALGASKRRVQGARMADVFEALADGEDAFTDRMVYKVCYYVSKYTTSIGLLAVLGLGLFQLMQLGVDGVKAIYGHVKSWLGGDEAELEITGPSAEATPTSFTALRAALPVEFTAASAVFASLARPASSGGSGPGTAFNPGAPIDMSYQYGGVAGGINNWNGGGIDLASNQSNQGSGTLEQVFEQFIAPLFGSTPTAVADGPSPSEVARAAIAAARACGCNPQQFAERLADQITAP